MKLQNIKGYYISNNIFHILKESENKTKDVYIQGLLLPRDEVSRNSVLYDWDSIKEKHKDLIGKPMLFNHDTEVTDRPLGTFVDSWLKEYEDNEGVAGWYYKARLNPRSQYYEDVVEGYINKVSIQVNAEKVVPEYKGNKEYQRAYIGDILEASGVNVPGFSQTSIETLIAEAYKKAKKEEYYKESTEFPYDTFKTGLSDELEEHPNVNPLDAAQLVLDHLKKDINYYSQNSDSEENKTEEINTSTASGAVAPAVMKDDEEEDTMSKENIKKEEAPIMNPEEDEKTKTEQLDEDEVKEDEVKYESIKKEEYDDTMNSMTEILEQMNGKINSLTKELDDLKGRLPQTESAVEDTEADEVKEEQADDTQVVSDDKTKIDAEVIEESDDETNDEEDKIDEPIPPITEKKKEKAELKDSIKKETVKKTEMTFEEAIRGFTKERLGL